MIRLSPVLAFLALGGCTVGGTNISGQWDCPAQQGRACTSIEEADSLSTPQSTLPGRFLTARAVPVPPGAAVLPAASNAPTSLLPEARGTGAAPRAGAALPAASDAPTSLLPEARGTGAALRAGEVTQNMPANVYPKEERRVRQAEILAKIWFYPFVDDADQYHEGGFVHVVLRPADWQIDPAHMFPAGTADK